MLKKGSVVRRIGDESLKHINPEALLRLYPPPNAICIVVSSPKEKDLTSQQKWKEATRINLKKAVDVLSQGSLYENCEVAAFEEL